MITAFPSLVKKLYATTVWHEMVAAIVAQAAVDYTCGRQAGLIRGDNTIDLKRRNKLMENQKRSRNPLPKTMEVNDLFSCISFLFDGDTLSDFVPSCWGTTPEAIRSAILRAADSGRQVHHFFDINAGTL